MKKILVTGALGQIGSELTIELRRLYGADNVIATDLRQIPGSEAMESGPFEILDVTDARIIADTVTKYGINTIYNLAALLSATAEAKPQLAWQINMTGLYNILEVARQENCSLFTPSSIGAFGPSTPADATPQDTIQRPTSMYGVTKVAGELLCDYYHAKFGVDTRGVRYPGIISHVALPGGGTTDYAVEIYYKALEEKKYTCFLKEGTSLDMMYMPDCINAAINLMDADPAGLKHRNAFNVTAMNFTPEEIVAEISKHIPGFKMDYDVDPVRQSIADSWPNYMDDSAAREEWGWNPEYKLTEMTEHMLSELSKKLKINY